MTNTPTNKLNDIQPASIFTKIYYDLHVHDLHVHDLKAHTGLTSSCFNLYDKQYCLHCGQPMGIMWVRSPYDTYDHRGTLDEKAYRCICTGAIDEMVSIVANHIYNKGECNSDSRITDEVVITAMRLSLENVRPSRLLEGSTQQGYITVGLMNKREFGTGIYIRRDDQGKYDEFNSRVYARVIELTEEDEKAYIRKVKYRKAGVDAYFKATKYKHEDASP